MQNRKNKCRILSFFLLSFLNFTLLFCTLPYILLILSQITRLSFTIALFHGNNYFNLIMANNKAQLPIVRFGPLIVLKRTWKA